MATDRLLALAAAGLLLASAGIHLDLYLTGYDKIPTIGPTFLAQFAVGVVIALAVLVVPRPVVAGVGALFAASTLGGYLLSRATGLFGFHEVATTAGTVAGALELGAVLCCAGLALRPGVLPLAPFGALAGAALLAGSALLAVAAGPSSGPLARAASATAASSGTSGAGHAGALMKVTINNFAFSPAHFTVHPGEKVEVTNKDSVAHTFTAAPDSTPQGAFNSGPIAHDRTLTVIAPTKPGTYAFYCSIHPFMTGAMTVS